LSTPEAWAGLKQRLIDHASTIGHADLARIYREEWLNRFFAQRRPATPQRSFAQQRCGTFKKGRFVAPEKPPGDMMKQIGTRGIDARHARALLEGFALFPEELPAHCEQLAGLAIADRATASLRDQLVEAAFAGTALDRDRVMTILSGNEAGGGTASRTMGFSFTRRDSDPERARSDLAAAVEILSAAEEVEKALDDATERLKRDLTDEAYEEQQRLQEALRGVRQRLASRAGSDSLGGPGRKTKHRKSKRSTRAMPRCSTSTTRRSRR
jgi:DNA primase